MIFSAAVMMHVFLTSLFVFFSNAPEKTFTMSADGRVSAQVFSGSFTQVRVDKIANTQKTVSMLVDDAYEISAQGGRNRVMIQYHVLDQIRDTLSTNRLSLFAFDQSSLSWKAIPSRFDARTQTFFAEVVLHDHVLVGLGMLP